MTGIDPRLPDRLLVTPEPGGDREAFLSCLDARLARGDIRLMLLRARTLAAADYRVLAVRAVPVCRRHGVAVLLHADAETAAACGADGIHLDRARLFAFTGGRPEGLLLSAAVHDLAAVARADALNADFMLASPVAPTATHPDAEPIGWAGFAALCGAARAPVYALGGMTPFDISAARRHGGQGIAAIRALWEDAGT